MLSRSKGCWQVEESWRCTSPSGVPVTRRAAHIDRNGAELRRVLLTHVAMSTAQPHASPGTLIARMYRLQRLPSDLLQLSLPNLDCT